MGEQTENISIWNENGDRSVDIITTPDNKDRLAVDDYYSDLAREGDNFGAPVENNGSRDMSVDGSAQIVTFTLEPPSGKVLYIKSGVIIIEDRSINFDKFGGIAGGLANGVTIKIKEGGLAERTFGPYLKNKDFYAFSTIVQIDSWATDIMSIRYNYIQQAGTFLRLSYNDGDYITFTIADDLTSLNEFYAYYYGFMVDE